MFHEADIESIIFDDDINSFASFPMLPDEDLHGFPNQSEPIGFKQDLSTQSSEYHLHTGPIQTSCPDAPVQDQVSYFSPNSNQKNFN